MTRTLRYTVLVAALILSPPMLESCVCPCGCSFGNDGPPRYDFNGMSMSLYTYPEYNSLPPAPRLSAILFKAEIDAKYVHVLSNGGSSLYACSPAPTIANQQITSIEIFSNHDLVGHPATAPAGTNLSGFFIALTEMSGSGVNEILNTEFRGNRLDFSTQFTLDSPQSHTFTFRITLDNGQVFEMMTPELTLSAG